MSADTTDPEEQTPTADASDADPESEETPPPSELAARIDLLETENRRIRAAYDQERRSTYRRTAIGLAAVGAAAVVGGLAFPANGTVLFSLGGIGFFGALLTYYLTTERFVAATVGEAVYTAHADNGAAVVAELGLSERRLYLPSPESTRPATLYVPQTTSDATPSPAALEDLFVATEDGERGVSMHPIGGALFGEFERALAGPLADDPDPLAEQLADGLIEEFELADGVDPDVAADGTRCVFGVQGSAFDSVDRFDHPIPSFLAVGLAVGLGRAVETEVTPGDGRVDHRVTCSWAAPGDGQAFGGYGDADRSG
jgi:hypothetical protein